MIDSEHASAALAAAGLPPVAEARCAAGYDATVWRVEMDGRPLAVRLLRPGVPAAREVTMQRTARAHGHPVPEVLATGRLGDREVVVIEWWPGRTLVDLLGDGEDPSALGRLMGAAQAALHEPVDPDGSVICHLDLQPFNVLAADGAVTGIVDWSNARLGDPREDLARTRVLLEFGPHLVAEFADVASGFTAGWRAGYAEVRPLPSEAELAPFLAAAAAVLPDEWRARAADGECPPAVVAAAEHLAEHYAVPTGESGAEPGRRP